MSNGTGDASGGGGNLGSMIVSGIIAAVIGIAAVYLLSLIIPFPWTLGQTMLSVAIASFAGSVVSFYQGKKAGA